MAGYAQADSHSYGGYGDTYDKDDNYENGDEYQYDDENDTTITPEDSWEVISSYFDAKGLVSQQIDSFNEFTETTINSLIQEYADLTLDHPNPGDEFGRDIALRRYD